MPGARNTRPAPAPWSDSLQAWATVRNLDGEREGWWFRCPACKAFVTENADDEWSVDEILIGERFACPACGEPVYITGNAEDVEDIGGDPSALFDIKELFG